VDILIGIRIHEYMDTLMFGCLDAGYIYIYIIYIYLYIYIYCICMSIYIIYIYIQDLHEHIPALCGCVAAAYGASFSWKQHAPGFFEHAYCQFIRRSLIWVPPLNFFQKSWQSGQITIPARRASNISAKRRAVLLPIISQSLIL